GGSRGKQLLRPRPSKRCGGTDWDLPFAAPDGSCAAPLAVRGSAALFAHQPSGFSIVPMSRRRGRAPLVASGAQERTRTFTAVKPLAPEASASTNSATWARAGYYGPVGRLSNWRAASQIYYTART